MDIIPAMRKLHVNQKGLVYLFHSDYNKYKGYGHYEIGRRSQWDIHL